MNNQQRLSRKLLKSQLQPYRRYLRFEKGLADITIKGYIEDIEQFIKKLPETIEEDKMLQYIESYFASLPSTLKTTTLARKTSSIRSFLAYLYMKRLLKDHPKNYMTHPRVRRSVFWVPTEEEVQKLLETIQPTTPLRLRNRAILELLYGSGLRASELIHLKLHQILWDELLLRIHGKGGYERYVPFNKICAHFLKRYIDEVRPEFVVPRYEEYVFLSRKKRPLTREMLFFIVKNASKEAGIYPIITPHTLRHAFATHMLENGADLYAVQQLLGHKTILTTEIYLKVTSKRVRETIDKHHPRP